MALMAHFEDVSRKAERRRSARRELRLGLGDTDEPVTIRDISRTGMLLENRSAMLVGATFDVSLPQAGQVCAHVVWTSGDFYGCEFDEPISAAAVSAALLHSDPRQRRQSQSAPDPLSDLRQLNEDVERIASRLDAVIRRIGGR